MGPGESLKQNQTKQPPDGTERAVTNSDGLPAFAADGTDLTVIRWMLSLSPEERLRWLQTHMRGVSALRRGRSVT
jgi:hypothetical protein